MSYSDRLKDIHDKEEISEIDESFYIERNCSNCKTCMKVSIKHLPKQS
jgi:hypothetical protein